MLAVAAGPTPLHAGDWPQILGPARDGTAECEAVIRPWSGDGPELLWTHKLGSGYAGPAVADGRLLVFHRPGNVERIEALDAATGQSLWQTDFPATYAGGIDPDKGPRCVPLIDRGRVFVFSPAGQMHCVALGTGAKIWSRDLYTEFRAPEGYFGAGSTPIVAAEKLLVNVGGRDAGLVALDLATGDIVWNATTEAASYSSPTQAEIGGRTHVIFVTRLNVVSIDPRQGTEHFRFPFGKRGATVNAATPLVHGDRLFVSAAYGVGAKMARVTSDGAQVLWENDSVMSSQYTTCVWHKDHLYGSHGREDYGNGELRCVAAATGELNWSVPGSGVANVILCGDQLLALTTDGELYLAPADPIAFRPSARARVSNDTTRALPALANGRFYFRENASEGGRLVCLKLAEE